LRWNDVDAIVIAQRTQRSTMNFKSISTMLLKTLSDGSILPIYDVH